MDTEEEWIPVILYYSYVVQKKTNLLSYNQNNETEKPINLTASSEIKIKQTGLLSICQDYTDGFGIQNKIRNAKLR